jgi:hypothetical protein
MIPKSFIILKSFPFNSSDKIDKKNLPKPDLNDFILNLNEYIEPKTEIEIKLVKIFKNILHLIKFKLKIIFLKLEEIQFHQLKFYEKLMKFIQLI